MGIKSGEDLLTWARLAVRYRIAYSAYRGAIFWVPEDVYNRPGRFTDIDEDLVGNELVKMLANAPHAFALGLRRYIGHWYEMRAIIALQLNRRSECWHEIRNILHYSQPTIKLAAMSLLSCLPGSLPSKSYKWLKRFIHRQGIRDGVQHGTP